ncbi:FAD-dependent oxidoreductase [Rurimicrobium arvi]|uniref:FAD-dependent oxidoreductase n=1 Tax=Rurimicrobium arvi TaxID=2049916 RepID=A0ABP8MV89_9BACT
MISRDGANTSIWQSTERFTAVHQPFNEQIFDVLIIGGGITGVSTALQLQQAGKKCVLIEAHTLGFGTTGGTTAHLNTFVDEPFWRVQKNFGAQNAQLLADGVKLAMSAIEDRVKRYSINCDYRKLPAYLYAVKQKQVEELDDILTSCKEHGVDMEYVVNAPITMPYLRIAEAKDQAQFHPVSYIHALAEQFQHAGGVVLEHCKADAIAPGEILNVQSSLGIIKARNVVFATHIPTGVNMIHFRCAPYRSYVIACKLKDNSYPDHLLYDLCDPYHYFRTHVIDGEQYLIAGGEDHKTGHEENTNAPFRRLESYVRSYFDIAEVSFKWSSQYYESVDGLPFIGHMPGKGKNVFVATAFGGNGMIYGTLSASIISDLIVNGSSRFEHLFHPSRIKPAAAFHNFVKENADVVKEFVSGKFSSEHIDAFVDVAAGEAKLVELDNQKIAFYKDEHHHVHAILPTCTHAHCTVVWNESELSWDCPCHGARFSISGEILNGPANKPLKKLTFNKD